MSNFDPSLFMQETIDAPLETEFKTVADGEYRAVIDDFTSEAFKQYNFNYKKGPKAGQPGSMTKFTVPFVIDDPQQASALRRERLVVYKELILDLDDGGRLATGVNQNVFLGQIRAAVGQKDRLPWAPGMLANTGPLVVKVAHELMKDSDGKPLKDNNGKDKTRVTIDRVAPIV